MSTGGATTVELPRPRGRRRRPGNALTAHGEPMVWLTGGALAICLIMILGLLALVLYQGVATFWPGPLTRVDLRGVLNAGEGRRAYLGEITRQETYFLEADNIATMTDPGQRPLRERAIELLRPRLEPALARLDDTGRLDYAVEEARQAIGQINAGAEDAEFANAVRAAVKQVNAAWSDLDRAPFTRSMDRGLAASRSLAESLSAAARAIGKDVQAWRERELGDRTPRPDALSEVAQHPQFRAMERLGRNIDSAQRRVAFLRRQMRLYRAAPDVQQAVRDREDRDFLAVLVELKQSDDPGQAAAAAVAMDAIEVEHSRRLFRTANFDLTRTHFHWIPDFAIAREREPNWAVVVERLRGGRYQGEPTSFAQRTERRPGERERRLAQARTLITQGMAMVDRSQRGPMMAAYTRVNQRLAELRAKASRRFVDRLDIDPDARLELKLQTGKTVASDQWDRTTAVREAIEVWTGPEAAWAQMKRMRDEVLDRREQHEQIKEHQIGRVNQRMSDARLALRGAALAYDKRTAQQRAGERGEASNGLWDVRDARRVTFQTRLVGPAKRLVDANRRLATIREENGKRAELIAWVNRTQDANDPVIAACRAAAGAVDQRAAAQVDEVEQQIAELQSRLDEAPPSLQAPLDRFLAVYRESTERIAELTGLMKALEAENARHELRVRAVQGHVEPIAVGQIVRAYPANQVAESLGAQM
ncbi:MAG: hypothetical protein GVY27_03000, partial [Deinococcus-Thermus bacterium]|nr:hypothetical protein [Deinococcota bacterium]